MKTKYKILALCGPAGAGKDTVLRRVCAAASNVNEIISCTTRPPREGEVDGKNYHFLTNEQFTEKILNGDMLEATNFNDWFYGTSIDALSKDKVNIGVFNPEGIMILIDDPRVELEAIYIWCPAKIRLLRQLDREDNPDCYEICRRFFADEEDFVKGFLRDCNVNTILRNATKTDLENAVYYILSWLDKNQ